MSTPCDTPPDRTETGEEPTINVERVSSNQSSFFSPSPLPSRSRRRIPISKTAAYSWLSVQKIMEHAQSATGSVTCSRYDVSLSDAINGQSESELLENPGLPEQPAIVLTRIASTSTASTVSSGSGSDDMVHNSKTHPAADSNSNVSSLGGGKIDNLLDGAADDGVDGYVG